MRVGVIGLGSIARKHIAALRELYPDVQIFALRHSSEANSEEGVVNIFSYADLLLCELDFVIISNPTSEHHKSIELLASSNLPLFIEKPLFSELTAPPQISALTYVACNLRFLESLQFIRGELVGKRVNEVNSYCGSYLPQWREGGNWRECYSANKEMGGGVHIDLIHEIDYLYWLFDKPSKVQKTFRNVSSLNISAYDYANYILEYEEFTVSVVLNYYRRDYKRTLEIVTEQETYFIDLAKNSVLRNGVEVFRSDNTILDTYKSQLAYFIDSLKSVERFNDINQAYEVLKICLER